MKKINLGITGCLAGCQQIIKSVKKDKNFKLVALTSKKINKKINGIYILQNTIEALNKCNYRFYCAEMYIRILKIVVKLKKE